MKYGIGFAQAMRTLSIINLPGKDAKGSSTCLYYYPLAGVILGSLSCIVPYFIALKSSLAAGFVFTLCMALLTRGFHLDGLGDTADGFFGAYEKEKILSIMSDSRSGSFAVVAICLALVCKVISFSFIFSEGNFALAVYCVALSRTFVVILCTIGKYAKENGLSHSLVEGARTRHALSAVLCCVLFMFVLLKTGYAFAKVFVPFSSSMIAMIILYAVSYRKIGGITGDVLGACAEITECAASLASILV